MTGGPVYWTTISEMVNAGYVDGYRQFHGREANGYTFPTWDPHVRLDYVFVPSAYGSKLVKCEVLRDGAAGADRRTAVG